MISMSSTNTVSTTRTIIPESINSRHAYAFGYVRGAVKSLRYAADAPYYDEVARSQRIEEEIDRLVALVEQLEHELEVRC
jgi:hypothetical protein